MVITLALPNETSLITESRAWGCGCDVEWASTNQNVGGLIPGPSPHSQLADAFLGNILKIQCVNVSLPEQEAPCMTASVCKWVSAEL